ncbi:MAG: hypothetical protein JXR10_10925 [Cyclobacteriaceae bacterium]
MKLSDGHIILIHYSGKFFEFEGDTTFNISDINLLAQNLIKDPKFRFRPEPNFLFAVNYIAASGSNNPPIILLSDVTRGVQKQDGKLCLEWVDNDSYREIEKHVVSLKDINEQDLDRLITHKKRVTLDFTNYSAEHKLHLVNVYDSARLHIKSNEVGVKYGISPFYVPNGCNLETAIDALEYAFHLERMSFLGDHILPFYKLATELSDQIINAELLEEFNQRMSTHY